MSKFDTMFSEKERLVTIKQMSNFNLNPFAFWGMIETYIEKIHPLPIHFIYTPQRNDMQDQKEGGKAVELWINAVGYLGKERGDLRMMDEAFTTLFCRSYYEYMRPLPASFQIMDAIEIHLRTPGVAEDKYKNPFRDIYIARDDV